MTYLLFYNLWIFFLASQDHFTSVFSELIIKILILLIKKKIFFVTTHVVACVPVAVLRKDHSLRTSPFSRHQGSGQRHTERWSCTTMHVKIILLDKCEITSNYKVNVSECNQILTMGNDMIFTTYNDLVIILYIMILSKFLLKFSPF